MTVKSKIIIITIISLILVGGALVLLLSPIGNKIKSVIAIDNIKEEHYIAYVSINPLVKLDFKIKCEGNKCEEPIISNYELVNEDAKKIYKDIDLKEKSLNSVIEILGNTAKDNNIDNKYIDIYTDWENCSNYISSSSSEQHYIIKYSETAELTNQEFEDELISDPYIVTEVEIPAPITHSTCSSKTKLNINSEYDAFRCGPSEYCGYMTYDSHPDLWEGAAYVCLFADVNGCVVKVRYVQPIIKVKIRTRQSIYDKFKNNKCYELKYDEYCTCKDSYVSARFSRDNLEVGKHKVEAIIKSSSNIEILPFENGYPYIEFELIENQNYEQEQKECASSDIVTQMPLPTCTE